MENHETKFTRVLEMLPGSLAWGIILFPAVGGFFAPSAVAYSLMFFIAYWFIKSFKSAFLSIRGYFILKEWERIDFSKKYKGRRADLGWKEIKHVVIVPIYKESVEVVSKALQSLADQIQIDKKQLIVVLAMEGRTDDHETRSKALTKKFKSHFGALLTTVHPDGIVGEIKGKASNEAWAARRAKEWLDKKGIHLELTTVTSCDADTIFNHKYFAALNYEFATNPERYERFWQSPLFWYNNFHKIPFPTKMMGVIGHAIHLSDLQEPSKLIFNMSSYSLSFKLLHETGYWDTDIIPEDWHLFLQTFYATQGRVLVDPLYLPTYIDAPEGQSWFGSLKVRYEQTMRHAWGASDIPYAIKESIRHPEISLLSRFSRIYKLVETHVIWSTNWFVLTLGATIPLIVNPAFAKTSLGYNLPRAAETVLQVCLIALVIMVTMDMILRPPKARPKSVWQAIFEVVQWVTLPFVTLPLSVLPGLHAQTILLSGRRIEYKVTEKI